MKDKCEEIKKFRMEEHRQKSNDLSEKERALTRKTNQLIDDLMAECEDTPFHKALIRILKNVKGSIIFRKLIYSDFF